MLSKRAYAGNWGTHIWCERCGARLDVRKSVWLTLDTRTGTYTDEEIPDEFNQGAFSFGKDCAEKCKSEHIIAKGKEVQNARTDL